MNFLGNVFNLFQLPFSEDKNTSLTQKIFTALLVLCPILQHYKGLFHNAGTTAMSLAFFYFGFLLLQRKNWSFGAVIPLILFSVYEIFNHGVGLFEFGREALLVAYCIAAASGVFDLKYYAKVIVRIATIASVLLFLQYACFYIFGFHLQLVVTSFLNSSAEQWVLLSKTGLIGVTGKPMSFYRPSAFFLEPSHLTLFCFPALAMIIFSPNFNRKHIVSAVLISLGIVLSTSGMGIALVFGFWSLYFLIKLSGKGSFWERTKHLFKPKNLIWLSLIIVSVVLLYFVFDPFRMSINRVLGIGVRQSAFAGRMGTGIKALGDLSGIEFFFGKQNWGDVHKWNMPGFFYTFYTQGFIGMLLSYGFYFLCLFKTKGPYFWISLALVGLSFITIHTHAAYYMLFYSLLLLDGLMPPNDHIQVRNIAYSAVCFIKNRFFKKFSARTQNNH